MLQTLTQHAPGHADLRHESRHGRLPMNTYKEAGLLQRLKKARQVTLTPLRIAGDHYPRPRHE